MKRAMLILTVFGILCLAAGQVQAKPHHGHHGHRGHHGYHHGGHYGAIVVRPPIYAPPRVVVPFPGHPPVMHPPVYRCRYYQPSPYYGFSYRGRGLSFGFGF